MDPFDPPFRNTYKILFDKHFNNQLSTKSNKIEAVQEVNGCEFDLPLIDLSRLNQGGIESEYCKREIAKASAEWGFFQVVNHGVSQEVLDNLRIEQVEAFKKPFQDKVNGQCESDFPVDSYRWGTASATCLRQLAWSEAFHVPLSKISTVGGVTGLRYPSCPISPHVFGLMPHTDSDFLTILHQDHIGGLQLLKNGKWIAVNPKQETLIVIIGDLFQAWSNGTYKSVEHRVVANKHFERFSTAYFLCPSYDTIIESCEETSIYRRFSFKEFKQQVQDDVKSFGQKIGLSSRYKDSLVVNGRIQLEGIDVDETFSPLDVKNAFLHGDLSETVYMHQPPRFQVSEHPDYVCLLQRQGTDIAYLLLYVDDIVLTAFSKTLLQQIISSLHWEFSMTDLGSLNYFLGTYVMHDSSGLILSQRKYATEILERAGYGHGTLDYGLQLFSSSTTNLVAYSDTDWAGCPTTRRSTSSYYVFLGNNLLSWSSKCQLTLSRSSVEAEYHGVANVVAETCWLRNLLRELQTPLSSATLIYCDNASVVYLFAFFMFLYDISMRTFSPKDRLSHYLRSFIPGTDIAYLSLYVDDIVLTASSKTLLQQIISSLHQEFSMTELGSLNYFLGISVMRDSSGMILSQRMYATKILERAGMVGYNPSRTPVDIKSKLGDDGDPVSKPTLYRSLAGSLQYLTFTHPDISYVVQQVYLYMHDPREPHFSALKRILWYVREAEYRGVANAVAETCWLRNLLRDLHTPLSSAMLVHCDTVSGVYLSSNPVQHQGSKHTKIDIHFFRDLVAAGHVRVLHVPSRYRYADIFTKGLSSVLFEEFRTSLSVRCPPAPTAGEC
ncbi:ribonuclease H-like domain-containing protein [Tanacetum coccineum]|uniref:Ribonuclease H-like domain-containing protein n=1 Tax=Tanacetum coccineum TaxID=301880 RepID=A0ABQ4ZXC6_9ASTR